MAHTPGEWRFVEWMGDAEQVAQMRELGMEPTRALTNEGQRTIMGPERPIALVQMQSEGVKRSERYKSDDAERDANARLIAAAPDLLEALKEARLQIEYLDAKFNPTGTSANVLARIERTISKAEAGE